MEPKPVVFPLENFKFIALPVAENKKAGGEGVQFKLFLDKRRQPVNGLSQIGQPQRKSKGRRKIDYKAIYQETVRQVMAGEAEHLNDLIYDPVIL